MFSGSVKSTIFVTVQFVLIFVIAAGGSIWGGLAQNVLMFGAVLLGLWAIITMRLHVNIFPDVRQKQQLITAGPYRYIRHPMYTAVLLATAAWTTNGPSALTVIAWLLLLVDLHMKLTYEEKLLAKHFPEYGTYIRRTKRLIPFVY